MLAPVCWASITFLLTKKNNCFTLNISNDTEYVIKGGFKYVDTKSR